MRGGLVVRAVGLAVIVWVVACCSSLSTVVAFNDSDKAITLDVSGSPGTGWKGTLEPRASAEVWTGFGGPAKLSFNVDGKLITYNGANLPPGFSSVRSDGAEAHWHWKGDRAEFEMAVLGRITRWFRQMMMLGCTLVIACVLGARWALRSRKAKLVSKSR